MSCDYRSSHFNDPDFTSYEPRRNHTARYGPIVLGADDQVSFTRRYAAPELLGAHAPRRGVDWYYQDQDLLVYDERVDFYSLGIMLRELALGEPTDALAVKMQDQWERSSDGQRAHSEDVQLDLDFEHFTAELLVDDPDQRLHGTTAKDDKFFSPISELWEDIAERHYPPFVNVVWQDADNDTGLNLRSYSGTEDSRDNLASVTDSWKEAELAEIPYDGAASTTHATRRTTPEEVMRARPLLLPAVMGNSRTPSCLTLDTSSFLSGGLDDRDSDTAVDGRLVRNIPALRRRRGMQNLRQAFRLGPDVSSEPLQDMKQAPGHRSRARRDDRVQAVDVKPHAVAAEWSFEHQITIALLATMVPPGTAPLAARGHAEPVGRYQLARREASRMKSFFRKLKTKGARLSRA
ncbi:hypothetical protein BN946_scf184601.g24 [Trametes cinnabarina]|uniref:Protein kinase domain-containing protein n=1 Tax=Pycnoporus cinnabarinus TaxID=5643 RepID=A0A060S761_PYCCI|nr:hypothetical protein BN946_scf184601.g24 [Trametes cinnabarina]